MLAPKNVDSRLRQVEKRLKFLIILVLGLTYYHNSFVFLFTKYATALIP